MIRHQSLFTKTIAAIAAIGFIAAAWAFADQTPQQPQRYPLAIENEDDLSAVCAAGLVGDALGYDAAEVLHQARAVGMPNSDIAPTFYLSYLSGKRFLRVVGLRAGGKSWGEIAAELDLDATDLNAMAIPEAVSFTHLDDVPDQILEDMFVCSLLAHAYDLSPDRLFVFYKNGWHSLDVLVAAQFARRSSKPLESFLTGKPRDIDWYARADQAGISIAQIANDAGRLYDNITPVLSDEPTPADLETMYSMDIAADYWDVPVRTVREVRYRYLYAPSELIVHFYVSDLGGLDYWRVGSTYAWDCYHSWGPTIVKLGIPRHHFRGWAVWRDGPIDFYAADVVILDRCLLRRALACGPYLSVSMWDPIVMRTFLPRYAIFYCGTRPYHRIPFHRYYDHCRRGRPWHHYDHWRNDYVRYREDTDWIGHRRVGTVTGTKHRLPPYNRDQRGPAHVRRSDPTYRTDRYSTSRSGVGLVVGSKSTTRHSTPARRPHTGSPAPSPGRTPTQHYTPRSHSGTGEVIGAPGSGESRRSRRTTPTRSYDSKPYSSLPDSAMRWGLSPAGRLRSLNNSRNTARPNTSSSRNSRTIHINRSNTSSHNSTSRPSGYGLIGGSKSSPSRHVRSSSTSSRSSRPSSTHRSSRSSRSSSRSHGGKGTVSGRRHR